MWNPIPSAPLINPGDMCYVNASLQMVYQVLYDGGRLPDHSHKDHREMFNCWTCKLFAILRTMKAADSVPFLPMDMYSLIDSLGLPNDYDLETYKQSDAFSFLSFLINTCNLQAFKRKFTSINCITGESGESQYGNAFMLTLPTDGNERRSIQELFDVYQRESLPDSWDAIETVPTFALICIRRYISIQVAVGVFEHFKLSNPVAVSEELNITVGNHETVSYDIFGTINHFGHSAQQGHYIAYLKSSTGWIRMEDETVNVEEYIFDEKEPYMVIYKKRGNATISFNVKDTPPTPTTVSSNCQDTNRRIEITLKTEPIDIDDVHLKSNPTTSSNNPTVPHPTLILNTGSLADATRREVSNLVGVSKVVSIMRIWKIIMFIPKRVVGDPQNFKERFENLGKNLDEHQTDFVLYTFTPKNGTIIPKLMRDEFLKEHYDAYNTDLLKGVGYESISVWLASVFIAHILHTRYVPAVNGVKFNFVFNWLPGCLVTRILKQEYAIMREYAIGLGSFLTTTNLFCVDECRSCCRIDLFPHHLNLMQMTPLGFDRMTTPSIIDMVFLRWNRNLDQEHPMFPLYNFEDVEPTNLDSSVIKKRVDDMFQELDALQQSWQNVVVYGLLIVTPNDGSKASAKDLLAHSVNRTARFDVYAGMSGLPESVRAGYRVTHFNRQGFKESSVCKALRRNSSVYLFSSVIYDRSRGTLMEAAWIEILMGVNRRSSFLHQVLKDKGINRQRQRSSYFGADDNIHENVKTFLSTNQKMFIFQGDNDNYVHLDMEICGCYKITDEMEIILKRTFRNLLPL